jgi:UDP-N-acetyl-D-mannosaminuronic acid dehydrogenase
VDILRPGVGVGGHCISVDPWFLVEAAPDTSRLIRTAREVNDAQPAFVAELVEKTSGGLEDKIVCQLGLSFKPNVDDLRESPAVRLAQLLTEKGARVRAYEPFKPDAGVAGIEQVDSLETALIEVDVVLLAVAHDQFRDLKPQEIRSKTKAEVVFDAVRTWDKADWEKVGFRFYGLARKY